MTAKRVRSRKSKTAPKSSDPLKSEKKPARPDPAEGLLTDSERRALRAKLRTEGSRRRRQEEREKLLAAEAAKPVLPPPPATCNEEELRFIAEYMKDLNGSAAMLRAGITDKPAVARVYASRYLDRPHVLQELSRQRQLLMARQELSLERVLEELRRVGLTRLSDVVTWGDDGVLAIKPTAQITDEQLSAIESIEEIPGMFGSRLKVRMHKKVDALKDLRKYFSPTLAEARFGATGGGSMGGGPATIIVEGGPTGLEINVNLGGDSGADRPSGELDNAGRVAPDPDPVPDVRDRPAGAPAGQIDRTHPAYNRPRRKLPKVSK